MQKVMWYFRCVVFQIKFALRWIKVLLSLSLTISPWINGRKWNGCKIVPFHTFQLNHIWMNFSPTTTYFNVNLIITKHTFLTTIGLSTFPPTSRKSDIQFLPFPYFAIFFLDQFFSFVFIVCRELHKSRPKSKRQKGKPKPEICEGRPKCENKMS